jgi:flagella basal body P-ring formation protein FlgA
MLAALCLVALAPIPADALPIRADFAEAPCGGEATGALRYDARRRVLAAARDIATGETIAAPSPSLLPDVRRGDPLTLVARVGTAIVERQVTAAQPGWRGRGIFVRTPDGRLVAAPLIGEPGQ